MAERTYLSQKINHPFYCQYRAVYEHAVQFVETKHVLDIGCGEGYGAHLLAQHAKDGLAVAMPNTRKSLHDIQENKTFNKACNGLNR